MLQRHNDGVLYSSQFSKRAQPAIKRITRIRAPAEVIAHLMSVVGAQVDAASTSLLNFHQGFHHLIDRHVPFEQIGLVEIAPGISFGAAYVHEIHPVAEFAQHRPEVIVSPDAEAAGAQIQAVRRIRDCGNEFPEITSTY